MLDNFRGKLKKRDKQEEVKGVIVKKRKGRPKKPNIKDLHLSIDGHLKKRLKNYACANSTDMSVIVSQLVRSFLEEKYF